VKIMHKLQGKKIANQIRMSVANMLWPKMSLYFGYCHFLIISTVLYSIILSVHLDLVHFTILK